MRNVLQLKTKFLFLNHELLSSLVYERERFSEMINKCRLHQMESARRRQRLGDLQKLTEHNVLFAKDIKREFLMAVLTQHATERVDPQLPRST